MNRFFPSFQKILPTVVAVMLFLVTSALYFAPQFSGDRLTQHDTMQYDGMARDIKQMRAETGDDPQWTGAMFGGMPAYLIDVSYPSQLVVQSLGRVKNLLDTPMAFIFFAMLSMWLMLRICRLDGWLALAPALAYGFSTYFLLIIEAGHVTKMWAMVWAPLMMGGAWMTLRGNRWYGAALTGVAASLEIGANHPQITYYFLMALALFWISEGVVAWRGKQVADFLRRTALLAAVGIVAVLSNLAPLWYTMQHTKDTIRGGSELAVEAEAPQGGLDLAYATAWSYGRAESWNLLIPDFAGRDSSMGFSPNGEVAAVVNELGLRGMAEQLPAYWGGQPYTAGPTYLGAAALFLAVLGVLLTSGRNRWWLVVVSLLMLFLAWGRNWMAFTEFFFAYLPGYNKFRTVSMTLCVVQWVVPFLAALALREVVRSDRSVPELLRATLRATAVTGGLCLLFIVAGGSLCSFGEGEATELMTGYMHDLFAANDMQAYIDRGMDVEWGEQIGAAMAAERCSMMQSDAWRSLIMILLAAGAVALYVVRKVGKITLAVALAAVVLLDMVPVDLRFLSHDDFQPASRRRITMTAADKAILQDKEPGYRVLNLTVSPFNDATTSYFHRSVGGYHGAKLARYQDLIDRYLSTRNEAVLDMLNTRYLILPDASGRPTAERRGTELSAAWFVERVAFAPNAEAEIDLLDEVDLRTTAVVAGKDADRIRTLHADISTAGISLEEYRPNYLRYRYTSPEEAVALFSEIFYDKGWTAYVDGEEWPYFRADYVLRGMELPAGEHQVEWRFRAPAWGVVNGIMLVASLVILLGAVAAVVYGVRRRSEA